MAQAVKKFVHVITEEEVGENGKLGRDVLPISHDLGTRDLVVRFEGENGRTLGSGRRFEVMDDNTILYRTSSSSSVSGNIEPGEKVILVG